MGLSVKVDSATSVAGKTIALVVAYAGVGDKIGVAEGAAAGSIELDAGPDGKLEGLATVCKFVASLASEPVRGQLAGASPEDEAMISEWLARAAAEYGVEGAVGDEKLAELDMCTDCTVFDYIRNVIDERNALIDQYERNLKN